MALTYTLRQSLVKLIKANCAPLSLDPYIVGAICLTESSGGSYAARYEPNWKYLVDVAAHAKRLGITADTERTQQMFSMGPLQCMGSVARELGMTALLGQLLTDEVGIQFGVKKIHVLSTKYPDKSDLFAAYNAGASRKDDSGQYENQEYVDRCNLHYADLKEKKLFQDYIQEA